MSIRTARMSATSIFTSAPWRRLVPALVKFETFRSLARVGTSIEAGMVRTGVPPSCPILCRAYDDAGPIGVDGGGLSGIFYGREDIIPEMFSRLRKTVLSTKHDEDRLRHFIYYIERHIELDGDSHGPMGRELLEVWSRTLHKEYVMGLCALRATAFRPGLSFGMAH